DENLTFEDLLYQADSDYVYEEMVIQVRGANVWHMVASDFKWMFKIYGISCIQSELEGAFRSRHLKTKVLHNSYNTTYGVDKITPLG
ncbi:43488_t:CDS:2, partial [Gigaspora margarita]